MAATGSKKATSSKNAAGSRKASGLIQQEAAPKAHVPLRGAIVVFITAFVVRLIYFASVRHCPLFLSPTIDAKAYYDLAHSFAHGQWLFPPGETCWQPPFYPAVLAVWMHIVGQKAVALKLVQFAVGSANCALIYALGTKIFDRRIGMIAGLAAALYAPMIYFDGELLTPTVQIFFNLCVVLLLYSALEKHSVSLFAISGLVFGLSIITRPDVGAFLPAALIWAVVCMRKSVPVGKLALMCALFLACAAVPICVIAERNIMVGHERVMISRNGGINFYIGNNADERKTQDIRPGAGWETLIQMPREPAEGGDPFMKPTDQDSWFYAKAWDWAESHPGDYILLQLKKAGEYLTAVEGRRNHDLYFYRQYSPFYSILIFRIGGFAFPFGLMFPLAVFGILRSKWERKTSLLYCYLITQLIATAAFFVCARYRMTAIPVLLIFAAFGAVELIRLAHSRHWSPSKAALITAIAALIFTNANVYNVDTRRRWIEAESHYYMGRIYGDWGKYDKACAEYKKSISLDPEYQDTHLYYAMTLVKIGKDEQARQEALAGLKLYPTSPAANDKCGTLLMDMGDLWSAYRCFSKADELHPWSFPQLAALSDKAFKKRDFLLVLKSWECIAAQRPADVVSQAKAENIRRAYEKFIQDHSQGK